MNKSPETLCSIPLQTLFSLSLVFAVMVSASCAPRLATSLEETAKKYHATRLGKGAVAKPGSVAWSPDGRTLAFIDNKKITLYDAASTELRTLPLEAARFLAWSPDNELFVISRSQDHDVISLIDRETMRIVKSENRDGTEALYVTPDNRSLLLLTAGVKQISFGTDVTLRLLSRDRQTTALKPVYEFNKLYPTRQPDITRLFAWTHAGFNPVDNSLLMIEHVKPPVVAAYSQVVAIDLLTGEAMEIAGKEHDTVFISASWSPDGRHLALTDENGRLSTLVVRGKPTSMPSAANGYYPAWSPGGDRIYVGGMLIDPDGNKREPLMSNDAWSMAAWSPEGTRLAVASAGDLWLFSNIGESSAAPSYRLDGSLVKKMSLLQNLFREGLVTREEYRERRDGYMKGQ